MYQTKECICSHQVLVDQLNGIHNEKLYALCVRYLGIRVQ